MKKNAIIRQMEKKDLNEVTDIHMQIRPKETTMTTRLGRNFCYELIKIIYKTEPASCFIAEQNKKIVGYFLGTSDFKKLNKKIIINLGPYFIPKLLTKKYNIYGSLYIIIYFIYYSLKYSSGIIRYDKSVKAEEIEIAVLPKSQREGIASFLVKRFFYYLKSKNIEKVRVSSYKKETHSIKFHSKFYSPICTVKTPIGYIVHFVADLKNWRGLP